MKLNDKHLESFMLKAEADPKIMEMMKGIMYWCQEASEAGIPMEEVAAVGTVGYQIAKNEDLKVFFEYLVKLNELGITPVEH